MWSFINHAPLYRLDLNLHLVQTFETFLQAAHTIKTKAYTGEDGQIQQQQQQHECYDCPLDDHSTSFPASVPLVQSLLESRTPFVLIACTVRHPDTFNHFLSLFPSLPSMPSIPLASGESPSPTSTSTTPRHPCLHLRDVSVWGQLQTISSSAGSYYYENKSKIRLFCITLAPTMEGQEDS